MNLLLMIIPMLAQTRIDPRQIVDPNQVRVRATDLRPATLILPKQIADGRRLKLLSDEPQMAPYWPGAPLRTEIVCLTGFVSVGMTNRAMEFCLSAAGQLQWLQDPVNAAWFQEMTR